jgi:hypothetical protein
VTNIVDDAAAIALRLKQLKAEQRVADPRVAFIASESFTIGDVTVHSSGGTRTLTLHKDGKPLTGDDIPNGSWVVFNGETGEVSGIEQPLVDPVYGAITDDPATWPGTYRCGSGHVLIDADQFDVVEQEDTSNE